MSGFPVDGSNYTVNSLNTMARTANINSLTCSSNCTILTNGYFLSVSNINVNSGSTLILDNSGGGGVASSFILNSGNLQLNLANDLPCNITNNGNLIFNVQYKDCIYYGSLSGSGTFKKTGAYNLTMTNNNTISGVIEVDSGTMTVNGTLLNSTITVDSSANLSGFGSVGNVIISPNATISSSKINNGLTIGSVANNLVAGNGTNISNNIVSCFPYILKYANLINGVLVKSPSISSAVYFVGTEFVSYTLTFATPIVDISSCLVSVSGASNGTTISSLTFKDFTKTSISLIPKSYYVNNGGGGYGYTPQYMSMIIYSI